MGIGSLELPGNEPSDLSELLELADSLGGNSSPLEFRQEGVTAHEPLDFSRFHGQQNTNLMTSQDEKRERTREKTRERERRKYYRKKVSCFVAQAWMIIDAEH